MGKMSNDTTYVRIESVKKHEPGRLTFISGICEMIWKARRAPTNICMEYLKIIERNKFEIRNIFKLFLFSYTTSVVPLGN